MKLGLVIFQNRLRFQLLLAKITVNDFLGERLRRRRDVGRIRSKLYAISRLFSHEIRFSTDERGRKLPEKRERRMRGTDYTTNSVQCPCFFGTVSGDAQDAAARHEWREFRDRTS